MNLSNFEPFGEDNIKQDIQKLIKLWQYLDYGIKTNRIFLESKYKVSSELYDEYTICIIDTMSGKKYVYDYCEERFVTEKFLNGDFDYSIDDPETLYEPNVPINVQEYFAEISRLTENAHNSIEKECIKMGYDYDYDDDTIYLSKDMWGVTIPVWCSNEDDCMIEKYDH